MNTENESSKYKVLELWPETIANTRIKALIGRLSEIKIHDFGLPHQYESFDFTGSIFIFSHDSKIASYIMNNPAQPKIIDLTEFDEGEINMKGITYKSYHHKDYLFEAAFKFQYLYNYTSEYDSSKVISRFLINIKKVDSQISGKPKDGDHNLHMIKRFFFTIRTFLSKLPDKDLKYFDDDRETGFCTIEVIFQKESTTPYIVTNFSSFGLSISNIEEILLVIENQIFN